MSFPKSKLILLIFLVVSMLGITQVFRPHHRDVSTLSGHGISFVSESGQRLPTLFYGALRKDAYSPKAIAAVREKKSHCGATDKTPSIGIAKLLEIPTVHAQCPEGQCGGTRWVQTLEHCNTGGDCGGSYYGTTYDPMGDPCQGFYFDGLHCGGICECGYESVVCYLC